MGARIPSGRLGRRNEIRAVFREGMRYSNDLLTAYVRPTQLQTVRTAIVIRRQTGRAVVRNRLRRRLRELLRKRYQQHGDGADIVLVPGTGAASCSTATLQSSVEDVLRMAGLAAAGRGVEPGQS